MLSLISWWITLQVLGLAGLPLAYRALRRLPDRGYAFARPVGWLAAGYVLWLGGIFGLLGNNRGTAIVVVLGGGAAVWLLSRDLWAEIVDFLRQERRLVLLYEGMFLGVLAAWTVFKAYNPEIAYTEKPMEMAFLNAILRSDRFPPLDPWLSGFSISYYYFGYLLVALVTLLSGVASPVAYNLAVPTLMALTVTGAFSVVLGLTGRHPVTGPGGRCAGERLAAGGLGAFFVAVIGNLEGLLELLHAKGVGSVQFWQWLDIYNLSSAPPSSTWYPTDNWWWWRASRVINDMVLGQHREVIDEFPFFSFLLADLHPHVLALPFVLLALALAVDQVLAPAEGGAQLSMARWLVRHRFRVMLLALCVGALGFLNSWDLPTYTGVVVLGLAFRRWRERGRLSTAILGDAFAAGLVIGGLAVFLYLPFYLTLQSQASGVGAVLLEKTRLRQYLVIFGVFLWSLAPLLAAGGWRLEPAWRGFAVAAALPAAFAVVMGLGFGWSWWTVAFVVALVAVAAWRVLAAPLLELDHDGERDSGRRFALTLAAVALMLTFVTEFAFVRDTFGNRMNTVFKLYYQAWVLLAIAAAYGVYYGLAARAAAGTASPPAPWRRYLRRIWVAVLAILVVAGSYYPLAATYSKADQFSGSATLDGAAFIAAFHSGDYGAIRWLNENVSGAPVILEATGGEYSDYARISTFTGLPTVLGWGGHELQWRGNYTEPGKREPDIDAIYRGADRTTTQSLLSKYGVRYVIVGRMEREKGYDGSKFRAFMDVVYEKDGTTIFKSRD